MTSPMDERTKLVENILEAQHRVHKAFHRQMKTKLEGLPVTIPNLGLLGMLSDQPGLTVSELARQFMGAKSNISEMVERLAREGLLEKTPDAADQRLIRLHLTAAGLKVLKKIRAQYAAVAEAALTALTDGELQTVASSLTLLYNALDKKMTNEGGE